jgi:beta-lactamase regulating signal transducer with metallopeptidase domain
MPWWAALKALSMAYLLAALGLTLASALYAMTRSFYAPYVRASARFWLLCGAALLNAGLAVAIWYGVVLHQIEMTTPYFESLMFGVWSAVITCLGLVVLVASLTLAWLSLRRGRAHKRSTAPREALTMDGLRVVFEPAVATAALVGVWQPELWANRQYWDGLSAEQQRMVITHERQHLANHDNLRKLAVGAIAALYWALPWLRAWPRRFELDCELAVDHACRTRLPESEYRALVTSATLFSLASSHAAVASHINEADLRLRLETLSQPLSTATRPPAALAVAAVLLAWLASAAPGALLLQYPTLRCLLACWLGY